MHLGITMPTIVENMKRAEGELDFVFECVFNGELNDILEPSERPLDLVQLWLNEIFHSSRFYRWLKVLIDKRYNQEGCGVEECSESASQKYV